MWQQDGAGPHQANMVMDWLDSVFASRMLALKSRRGDSWAPSSPDMNPLDFFLWGYRRFISTSSLNSCSEKENQGGIQQNPREHGGEGCQEHEEEGHQDR